MPAAPAAQRGPAGSDSGPAAPGGQSGKPETAVREVLEQVRASPVGREQRPCLDLQHSQRNFLRRGLQGVVDEVLDSSFSGVLVSDFYATPLPGPVDIHGAGLVAEAVQQVYTWGCWSKGLGAACAVHQGTTALRATPPSGACGRPVAFDVMPSRSAGQRPVAGTSNSRMTE